MDSNIRPKPNQFANIYKFHYDYLQLKYGKKVKLHYMNTGSFVYEIETEDFYRDMAKDIETKFDTSR